MSKIVIPKHSADVDEMNAVLKIHYEAEDWVKGPDFKRQLMALIGGEQYPSSYPKKAQVPAYFGFLESKVSSGGRITERRITDTGKRMYEAILSDNLFTKQQLIMDALEKMVYGRNNAGCVSSNSDIEPPAILIKCILDTGYCTTNEYAYMVWALNDKCRKYYESLTEIIKARSAGGVAIPGEASDYKDWKPVLAMQRWGFLKKSDDDSQKMLLHPKVITNYSERLQRLKVYNIDKHDDIEDVDFDDISVGMGEGKSVYKPFKVSDENIVNIPSGRFLQSCSDIEYQNIFVGDQVLLVDRQITRLAAYYSYLVKGLEKNGCDYVVDIKRQFAINRNKEAELVAALKAEDELSGNIMISKTVKGLVNYDDYENQFSITGKNNKDVLPAYLIIRALLELRHLTIKEQDYLVYSIINDKETYSDAVLSISASRRDAQLDYCEEMRGSSDLSAVKQLSDKGIFEPYLHNGQCGIQINSAVEERYGEVLRRLSFYSVDIDKQHLLPSVREVYNLPKTIKALFVMKSVETSKSSGKLFVTKEQAHGQDLVQGDFIVFINEDMEQIQELFVFQIVTCKKVSSGFEIEFERRHVINPEREQDIIQMVKEA